MIGSCAVLRMSVIEIDIWSFINMYPEGHKIDFDVKDFVLVNF